MQNKQINLALNSNIVFGVGLVEQELATHITEVNKKAPFIITDEGLIDAGVIDKVTATFEDAGVNATTYSDVQPNPDSESVMKAVEAYKNSKADMIIAVGGGSALDFAKALAVAVSHPGDILEYTVGGKPIEDKLPLLFAIPTTIGTGSEVTTISVITDRGINRKLGLVDPLLMPDKSIIDPTLTLGLPRQHVAATGADALVHAIEAYTSLPANPVTDGIALETIKMIKNNLPKTYAHADNIEARSQVHFASTMAGLAFGLSGLGMVHSLSHPMSAVHNVPHGLANAIILPYIIEHNLGANIEKYAEIARTFDRNLVLETDDEAAEQLVPLLRSFLNKLDIPHDFGYLDKTFTEEMIDRLAEDAINDHGTVHDNPRKAYKEDIHKIYKRFLPQ